MIQLIASDLDGTILQNDAQAVSPRMIELIMELKQKGIRFAAASGRQYSNLRRLFEPIKDEISYIAENGSLCIHKGQVLSRGIIERELGLEILDSVKEYGKCDCFLSCESGGYMDSGNPEFIRHMTEVVKFDIRQVESLKDIYEPFLKIAVCSFSGTRDMAPFFKERFRCRINVVTSGNLWVDFIAPGANKGTALSNLLAHLDIQAKDCIAFGDQYNDVEMLQLAGASYAMSNAAPGIAYYSTYVTDSVEEVLEDLATSVGKEIRG